MISATCEKECKQELMRLHEEMNKYLVEFGENFKEEIKSAGYYSGWLNGFQAAKFKVGEFLEKEK